MFAEITDATLQALPAILNPGQDGYDDTSESDSADPESVGDLFDAPIRVMASPDPGNSLPRRPGCGCLTGMRLSFVTVTRCG